MERGLVMALHALIIGAIAYIVMVFVLKQNSARAEDRSVLLASCALIYMVLFGHGLPSSLNKNIVKL